VAYHVEAKDDAVAESVAETLGQQGVPVSDRYDPEDVLVVLGGDGSILYAARTYDDPTILPVRTGTSKGHQTSLDEARVLEAVATIETGEAGADYRIERHRELAAESEDVDLPGEISALNDVCLHHREPTMAAEFAVTLETDAGTREYPELIGDGLVVATPFGSSAYFRSITGTTFERGIGVAFNNVHWPADAPEYARLPPDAAVEVRVTETANAAAAVLTWDNHPDPIVLGREDAVRVTLSDRSVGLIRLDP
jgi:NAD+ kinase